MSEETILYPSLFEDDYITRSLGPIVNDPDVALTELVANAWDAGASHVRISIPEEYDQTLYIEDDGIGMTEEEFQNRWMKLRYNRLKDQGKNVVFPDGITGKRTAFGRNGVGRHGLFCFANQYKVTTTKNGKKVSFIVKSNIDGQPIAVTDKVEETSDLHGTKLEVNVELNLPKADKIREVLSARFLHDPQFEVEVNHLVLDLENLMGGAEPTEISIEGTDITLTGYFIDTTKKSRKSIFQGIAFWQGGRLVGEPSWSLGKTLVLDGRTALAKRYTFIIKSDDLGDYIKEDWSGFKKSDDIEKVYNAVEKYVNKCIDSVSTATIATITENLEPSIKESLKEVNPLVRLEVNEIIRDIVTETPKVKQESVNLAIKTILNVEKSKNGKALLDKLSTMTPDDIDGLNELLSKWTVGDALAVLNEIDRRLAIITAIRKLSEDKTTDELHVLHPMIAESRWLFGPEYESSEFIFNNQMKTAVSKIFGNDKYYTSDANYKKRPDLICMSHSTIGVTGIPEISSNLGISQVRHLLIIELKRGGFKIDRQERNQAQGYIEDLLHSNLGNNCKVTGFVVGESVADNIDNKLQIGDNGILHTTTYSQLVDTAELRMFGLRRVIADRYEDVPGMDLYEQVKPTLFK